MSLNTRARRFSLLACLVFVTLIAYQPAWRGGILWDDEGHLTRPDLRSAQGLARIWVSPGATQQYYPVVHSAFWLQHRLWGAETLGPHLVNIVLHAVSAFLIALILRQLAVPGAVLAAFIFALHPVHVESVAWMTELKNVLSGMFYLGAALAYLAFDRTRQRQLYALAAGLFVLALLSKTVTATLPAALLVLMWWRRGRLDWKTDAAPIIPFAVIAIASGAVTIWFERWLIGAEGPDFDLTGIERCLIAGRAVWFYLAKLLWPADLIFIYPRWNVGAGVWWQYLYPLAVVMALATLWWWRRRSRAPLAAMLLFCITLAPALGFFNVYPFLYSFVADHFQYLASIPVIALLSAGLTKLTAPRYAAIAPVPLVLILGFLTWRQAHHYTDAETLYRATLARNPSTWMAHNNLAVVLLAGAPGRERVQEAASHAGEAVRLRPRYAEGHYNLGTTLERLGELDAAVREYKAVLDIDPYQARAHHRLGLTLRTLGREEEAVAALVQATAYDAASPALHLDLGRALAESGRTSDAIAQFREASRLDPGSAEAHQNLGSALLQQHKPDEALLELTEAVRLDPTLADAEYNLGLALEAGERLDEAVGHYQRALNINPALGPAHRGLGRTLQKLGRREEAVAAYQHALAIDPLIAQTHNDLGVALAELNRLEEADSQFSEAVRLNPDDAGARENLARTRVILKRRP
jgi:tetratricopeptide (TPR) repeat protein